MPGPTALTTLSRPLASTQPPTRLLRCVLAVISTLFLLVGAATLWLIADGGSLTRPT